MRKSKPRVILAAAIVFLGLAFNSYSYADETAGSTTDETLPGGMSATFQLMNAQELAGDIDYITRYYLMLNSGLSYDDYENFVSFNLGDDLFRVDILNADDTPQMREQLIRPNTQEVTFSIQDEEGNDLLTLQDFSAAGVDTINDDSENLETVLMLECNPDGVEKLAAATAEHIDEQFSVIFKGEEIYTPVNRVPIMDGKIKLAGLDEGRTAYIAAAIQSAMKPPELVLISHCSLELEGKTNPPSGEDETLRPAPPSFDLSDYVTLADYHHVTVDLTDEDVNAYNGKQKAGEKALEQIVESSEIKEPPEELVEYWFRLHCRQVEDLLAEDFYAGEGNLDDPEYLEELRSGITESLKGYMVIRLIAERENIVIEPEDYLDAVYDAYFDLWESDALHDPYFLGMRALSQKVMAYLGEQVTTAE